MFRVLSVLQLKQSAPFHLVFSTSKICKTIVLRISSILFGMEYMRQLFLLSIYWPPREKFPLHFGKQATEKILVFCYSLFYAPAGA